MNTHTNKKVVCIKDIPSNLIEEAIFILKSDVVDSKNSKTILSRKEIINKEAENLVNEYSEEFENFEKENSYEKNKISGEIKLKIALVGLLIVMVGYVIMRIFV